MRKYLGILSLIATLCAWPAMAQSSARIVYTFEHPQLNPSKYTITIDERGAGHFSSQPGLANIDYQDGVFPSPVDRDIHLDDKLRSELFDYARTHAFFSDHCDRGRSGLAFTGNKTFAYSGTDGQGTCSFVWASDPVLQRLSDQLNAVAFTIEIGRRLEVEVRHDRLGLDSELEGLQDALKDQRAWDLPNIASDLQAIAENQQVMDRARKRALALLSRCESPAKPN